VEADPLFIVDGDNVTHARGHAGDYARARERTLTDVASYMAQAGIDAVVVLDGAGRNARLGRVQVVHSGGESADTVIERLAHRRSERREVTVVSSDAVLRHVAHRGGVHVMSAREFLDRLAALPTGEPAKETPAKRYTLADSLDPAVRAALERMRRGEPEI
jgi:predicted RNA-binding protein with PIN domain